MSEIKVPILLVDDRPANLLSLEAILDAPGYELVTARSGNEAVRALEQREFAVVLLDVVMPEMDGFATLRAMRRRVGVARLTPVILVTGLDTSPQHIVHAYADGAVDFVQKPLEPVVIRSKVAMFAELYRARSGADRQLRTEAELHASEERFHHLVNAVTDYAIFLLDPAGRVATWTPGILKIKGYGEDEILGRHFSVFYTAEDRASGKPERILATVRRDGRFEEESWRVRKDGSRFWASVVITALRDQHGEIAGFAKVVRDLTAKREAEETDRELVREQIARAAFERTSLELERLNRTKDEFLATMSHELRTPLNAISGWAAILRKKPREENTLDRGLEAIERNAKAQTQLISDLLDVSRIITGKLRLTLVNTDVFPLLIAAADVVRPAAEAKGVRLVVDIDPAIGAVLADPDRLQQIAWNLLTNAVRFTPRGGRVALVGERSASEIVIRVEDTGAGIAGEHLPHLFERFMQVDSSTTRSHGGLGIGLSIVRHLVEAHGGSTAAASEGVGRGATFVVRLPLRSAEETGSPESGTSVDGQVAAEAAGATVAVDGVSLSDLRLLVVEDDLDSAEVLRAVLQGAGAHVVVAASARDALAVLDAHAGFDVIVSDIAMPEMDGYALIRVVRARMSGANTPAIALTAYARSEDAERATRAGYQVHLAKPIEESRLIATVRALAGKADPAETQAS